MEIPLRIGDTLYGFCEGSFGRDSYNDKKVEAIASDWVVVREKDGPILLYAGNPEDLTKYRDPTLSCDYF